MKKLTNILIIVGVLLFVGIIYISARSETINNDILITIGFIVCGYIGVILFSYGWIKRSKE